MNGVVRDSAGLAVPGAEVRATQAATGAVRTVVTGSDGAYVLPNLPIGPYLLGITKPGFMRKVPLFMLITGARLDLPLGGSGLWAIAMGVRA